MPNLFPKRPPRTTTKPLPTPKGTPPKPPRFSEETLADFAKYHRLPDALLRQQIGKAVGAYRHANSFSGPALPKEVFRRIVSAARAALFSALSGAAARRAAHLATIKAQRETSLSMKKSYASAVQAKSAHPDSSVEVLTAKVLALTEQVASLSASVQDLTRQLTSTKSEKTDLENQLIVSSYFAKYDASSNNAITRSALDKALKSFSKFEIKVLPHPTQPNTAILQSKIKIRPWCLLPNQCYTYVINTK
jgi:hypothetical protein